MTLLSKTRKITQYLQQKDQISNDFNEMATILQDIIQASVYVLNIKSEIIGFSIPDEMLNSKLNQQVKNEQTFPIELNKFFLKKEETFSGLEIATESEMNNHVSNFQQLLELRHVIVVPLIGSSNRLGTLVLIRDTLAFNDDDYLIAEYGSLLIAMYLLKDRSEIIEQKSREKTMVQVAISSLSFSELEAIEHIFEELNGKEGLLVASKIADRVGITRSVIVNALRKLESASMIESRSLGMKGTYIRILNEQFISSICKSKNN